MNDAFVAALADRYRIERELGAGGMATVYLAEDVRHRRKVAVKALRPELQLGTERFLREIDIVAGLRHPHILPLYDSGEAAGQRYFVMPLVEGESLRVRMERERQLPLDEALRIAREVADALSYAHARGVVHRDIKPENILIDAGHAVIADFGIARAVALAGSATALTATGTSIGTPAYMSPEQASGEGEIDGRSDLYSLGCVLYEMLAGQPPFIGATVESLVRQHLVSPPAPVTQFRPAVPAAVADAIARALAKSPADRFNPVAQFAVALDATPSPATPATKPTRARRVALLVAIAGVAALGAWRIWRPAVAVDRSIAVLPFQNVGGDTAADPFVIGVHAEIVTEMSKLRELRVASRSASMYYRGASKSDRDIASELGVATVLTGSLQRSGSQIHLNVGLADARGTQLWAESYDRELTPQNLFALQAEIARQVAGALSLRFTGEQATALATPPTSSLAALDSYHRALYLWDFRGASGNDTGAVRLLEGAVATDPRFVQAWSLLAQTRAWLLRTGVDLDTLPAWNAVRRTRELAPGSLDERLAAGYYRYYARADYAGALEELQAAEKLVPNSAEIVLVSGLVQRRLGRWDDALATFQRALALDPHNLRVLTDIGDTYRRMHRWDDADRMITRVLAASPTAAPSIIDKFSILLEGRGDSSAARAFVESSAAVLNPGAAQLLRGRLAWYARRYADAAAAFGAAPEVFTGDYVLPSLSRALAIARTPDRSSARRALDETIASCERELMRRRARGPDDPFGTQALVEVYLAMGLAARNDRGDVARALAAAEGAARRVPLSRDAADGAVVLGLLARVYALAGRPADAVAVLTRLVGMPSQLGPGELRLDPVWDSLRDRPDFQALIVSAEGARGR